MTPLASDPDRIWVCPVHGIVGATHDPECPETIRQFFALDTTEDGATVDE